MRRLKIAAFFLLCAHIASALSIQNLPNESNCPQSSGSSGVTSISLPVKFTAGHSIVVWVGGPTSTTQSISSTNQSFVRCPTSPTVSSWPVTSVSGRYSCWIAASSVAGSDTVVITFSASSTFTQACLTSWTGVDPNTPTDSGAFSYTASSPSGNVSTPNFTATYANELVIAYGQIYTTPSLGTASGWTTITNNSGSGVGSSFQINPSTGSIHGTANSLSSGHGLDLLAMTLVPNQAAPVLSNIAFTPSATTITATWTSDVAATTQLACSATNGGPYTLTGLEDNTSAYAFSHHDIVASLSPGTPYYCVVISGDPAGNTQGPQQLITTTAVVSSTPLTGATPVSTVSGSTFGSRYNDQFPTTFNQGDSTYNSTCQGDGNTYGVLNDTYNFPPVATYNASTFVHTNAGSAMEVVKWAGSVPGSITGSNVNVLSNLGASGGAWKAFDISCLTDFYNSDTLLTFFSNQTYANVYGDHAGSNLMLSRDHGATWALWSNPTAFNANGPSGVSTTSNMFGSSNNPIGGTNNTSQFSVMTSVKYLPGNTDSLLVDQQNAYVYYMACGVVSGDSRFSNGDSAYLFRVPRWKIANMSGADWQIYIGGGADGTLDSSWSSTWSNGNPIITSSGKIGWCGMQWIPGNNRYLFTTTYYVSGTNNSQFVWYEAQHPWSTLTQIYTANFTPGGWFGSIPLQSSLSNFQASGNELTIVGVGNYGTGTQSYTTTLYGQYFATFQLSPAPSAFVAVPSVIVP